MSTRMVALLRGINVGGKRKIPMAELRELAAACQLSEVSTYIQSGNLVFDASLSPEPVAQALEAAIAQRFGFSVEVIVRTAAQWRQIVAACPYPEAAVARPNLLHLGLSRHPPHPEAAELLAPTCAPDEAVALVGDALWLDYAGGVGRSKLTAAKLDKAVGSTVTARNYKTLLQLDALLG